MSDLPTKLQARIDAMIAKKREAVLSESVVEVVIDGDDIPLSETLPDVSESKRAVPNVILRSSLFGVVGKGHRKYEKNVLKATVQGLTVKFTGEQLDQADLDVYLECVRRCASQRLGELGELVRFSIYEFLKSIDRKTGKSDHEWLKTCFTRLFACGIELGDGRFFYMGHLIDEQYRDEKTGEFVIALNPKIAGFFSAEAWTGLCLEERTALKSKQLAQWLHGFFSSHQQPFPYKVETIKGLCGSGASLKEFKRMLKKSLADLSAATGWVCSIDERDLVHVVKQIAATAKASGKGKGGKRDVNAISEPDSEIPKGFRG